MLRVQIPSRLGLRPQPHPPPMLMKSFQKLAVLVLILLCVRYVKPMRGSDMETSLSI